jgi:dihydrofolate reductase
MFGKKVILVVALDKNGLIGNNLDIPWPRIKQDMRFFKELTVGNGDNSVLYGKNTWLSLPEKFRPLPNRENVVLSRDVNFNLSGENLFVARSFCEGVRLARSENVFVIGGAEIYKTALPYTDELLITLVEGEFHGNIYFPVYDQSKWLLSEKNSVLGDTATGEKIPITFKKYLRKQTA